MSVWLCIPSARPAAEAETVLKLWRERGYRLALWCDTLDDAMSRKCDFSFAPDPPNPYPGYASAVNHLVKLAMEMDSQAEWFVTGGDDIHPDPNHTAEEIAEECAMHFNTGVHVWGGARNRVEYGTGVEYVRYCTACGMEDTCEDPLPGCPSTFGVMQPTGDRWGDAQGAYADRVCGSPWMGREFCRRIYSGRGPIWPEFTHMFEDEHLQAVAMKLGILWQRPDLIHYHEHWVRKANDTGGFSSREDFERRQPAHYKKWSDRKHWDESKAIFERLKAGGFKEAEDLLP